MAVELVDATLNGAVGVKLNVNQSLGPHLRSFHEVGELVELLACVVGASRHADTANVCGIVKYLELAFLHHVHKFYERHAETEVRFVASVEPHGVVPRHLTKFFGKLHAANFFEKVACHVLEDVNHVVLLYETHFAVDLREFGLAVGAQVLITEALRNLEVAVESAHHQQLLKRLWRLR